MNCNKCLLKEYMLEEEKIKNKYLFFTETDFVPINNVPTPPFLIDFETST